MLVAKEDLITCEGVVTEVLPNAQFRVQIDKTEHVILAYATGKMRSKKKIRVMEGDRVSIEISPYDMTKGRIVYRHK